MLLALGGHAVDTVVLLALSVACPAGLWQLGVLRVPRLSALVEERRRNRALRRSLARVRSELRGATDSGELWPTVRQAADRLGADGVELRLAASGELPATWAAGAAGPGHLCTHFPLAQGPGASSLELRWGDRAALDRDTEIAVEILCGEVSSALGRIRRRRLWARPALHGLVAEPTAVRARREPVA
jgi:UDP-GlcNAc:undecaprenyl-phosphate GlcNAc-1-phosphate transferase